MGKIGFIGDASKKLFEIKETATGEVDVVNETDGVTLLKADPTTITDAGGVQLSSHASRHGYGQPDAIPDDYLRYRQIKAVFASGSSVTVTAGGTYTLAEGIWYVFLGANTSCEVYDDVAGAWKTIISAGGVGLVISDGSNVRLYNAGTVDESSTIREVT